MQEMHKMQATLIRKRVLKVFNKMDVERGNHKDKMVHFLKAKLMWTTKIFSRRDIMWAFLKAMITSLIVDISSRSQPDRAPSAMNYGLTPTCNLSQSRHIHTTIACAHTTGNSNTHLSQVSYRNLLRSQYKQGCNQCEHSYKQVYQHINAHQLHLNAPYTHLSVSVSTLPVEHTN
jgi:hypothetical protein